MRGLVLAVGIAVAIAGSGCASLRPSSPAPRAADDAFAVSGRFAVRFGEEGGSGRLAWEHSTATDDLTLSGPLGQGIARIVRRDGRYVLTTADDREHVSEDPDELTEPVLGWRLPIRGLPYWLRGRALPDVAAEARPANGDALQALLQAGWLIEYQSRHPESGLPERMRLRRGDLDIRLVLDDWRALQ